MGIPTWHNLRIVDLTGLNEVTFLEEIMKERSRELCFEALRKQDLIRWGKLVENMKEIENLIDMEYSRTILCTGFPECISTASFISYSGTRNDLE